MKKSVMIAGCVTLLLALCCVTPTFAVEWVRIDVSSVATAASAVEVYDFSATDLHSVWGSGPDDVYVVGDVGPTGRGTVLHYSGSTWQAANFAPEKADRDLLSVWGLGAGSIFIGADTNRTIYYYAGTGWEKISSNDLEDKTISAFWGLSANRVWATGNYWGMLGYDYNMQYVDIDNTNVNKAESDPPTEFDMNLNGIWGSAESDVYAVGDYGCKRNLFGFCISGTQTNMIHTTGWKNGYDFTAVDTGSTATLYDIWGTAADDIFAVGACGTVLHYDGADWSAMEVPSGADLHAVWGFSGTDVYAAGTNGTILWFDGSCWTVETSGTTENLTDIWGGASDALYITGSGGTLLRSAADVPDPVCGDGIIEGDETCESDDDCPSGSCVDCTCQTLVTLQHFDAAPKNRKVVLIWVTAAEMDNAGFNIYRSVAGGPYEQVNTALIPAEGSSWGGASYRFVDSGLRNRTDYTYLLEDVDLDGQATRHGPVNATPRFLFGR